MVIASPRTDSIEDRAEDDMMWGEELESQRERERDSDLPKENIHVFGLIGDNNDEVVVLAEEGI